MPQCSDDPRRPACRARTAIVLHILLAVRHTHHKWTTEVPDDNLDIMQFTANVSKVKNYDGL